MTIKELWEESTARPWPNEGMAVPVTAKQIEEFADAVLSAAVLAKSQEAPTRKPIMFDPAFRVGQTVYMTRDKVLVQKCEVDVITAEFRTAAPTKVAYLLVGKSTSFSAQHLFATPAEAFQSDVEPNVPSTQRTDDDDDDEDRVGPNRVSSPKSPTSSRFAKIEIELP